MRRLATVLVALMVLLSGCGSLADGGPGETTAPEGQATTTQATDSTDGYGGDGTTSDDTQERVKPDDPESDRLGWEGGYWYNETLDVDRSDGLNDTELAAVVNRSMARVERIRGLEFERTVPVEIQSREAFRNESAQRYENVTTEDRLHQNVKWEAMLMVGEDTDALAVQQANRGSTIGGFYSPTEERIVIVSENTSSPEMDEITLSQELFHALQDQKFDITRYDQSTQELHNAKDGIIEGDGNYVDRLYGKRCEAEWNCLMPQQSAGGGGGAADIHFGMYFVEFQPYSDGPPFVKGIQEEEGWEGVNAVYENPPASTEQTIHPDRYEEDAPTEVDFEDTSGEEWRILEMPGNDSVNYASFGEAGLATMLYYPSYETRGQSEPVLPARAFLNYNDAGEVQEFDPLNYDHEVTAGWDGDRLYPYVNDSSAATNETGYVWKTVWDSEQDASEFAEGYRALLEYHGATAVDGREDTYRVPDDEAYGDAYYVVVDGSTVTIVNAPSVDDLDEVREGAAPAS